MGVSTDIGAGSPAWFIPLVPCTLPLMSAEMQLQVRNETTAVIQLLLESLLCQFMFMSLKQINPISKYEIQSRDAASQFNSNVFLLFL